MKERHAKRDMLAQHAAHGSIFPGDPHKAAKVQTARPSHPASKNCESYTKRLGSLNIS